MTSSKNYWIAYLIPLSLLPGYVLGAEFFFTTPLLAFVFVPILDYLLGKDQSNPNPEQIERMKDSFRFSLPLYLYVLVFSVLALGGSFWFATQALSLGEQIGLIVSTGIAGGLGITIAHELCHRSAFRAKASGFFLLSLVTYAHFGIEHIVGHHSRVATPEDPTTSRFGESAYRFVVRSIVGSFLSVYHFERKRVAKRGYGAWSFRNRVILCLAAPLLIATALGLILGPKAVLFFFAQSLVAIILLELTNYIEHYGLERKRLPNGKWERVTPLHSWNADLRLSNLFLFKLQRHADHHAHPQRPYQILRHFPQSPELPFGYPTMILMALVPPLWRAVMDPRVRTSRTRTPEIDILADS